MFEQCISTLLLSINVIFNIFSTILGQVKIYKKLVTIKYFADISHLFLFNLFWCAICIIDIQKLESNTNTNLSVQIVKMFVLLVTYKWPLSIVHDS